MTNREKYYKSQIERHQDAIKHHESLASQGIHSDYHNERADWHRQKLVEAERKKKKKEPEKKDLGPLSGVPQTGPSSGIIGTI